MKGTIAQARSVAAIGDVADVRSWSGIPFHFFQAAQAAGFAQHPWRLNLDRFRSARLFWNAKRMLRGQRAGGFQYSDAFLQAACAQIPPELFATDIISFHPHFPPCRRVEQAGGELNHYIDAPFAALSSGRGLDLRLPKRMVDRARLAERTNFAFASRVITMARWAATVVREECSVPAEKITTILPGANLSIDQTPLQPELPRPRAGREREFVLGFVGIDWKRKGLAFLVSVRDQIVRRGWKAIVRAAGEAPSGLAARPGVEFVGRMSKHENPTAFLDFLTGCDVGCLFSRNEALGISTLEFLRAGVPVAGFAHEGLADTVPPDAGFRFALDATPHDVADAFEDYLSNEAKQESLRRNARAWSPFVTWERCVRELQELWQTGTVQKPVRPWLGLPGVQ